MTALSRPNRVEISRRPFCCRIVCSRSGGARYNQPRDLCTFAPKIYHRIHDSKRRGKRHLFPPNPFALFPAAANPPVTISRSNTPAIPNCFKCRPFAWISFSFSFLAKRTKSWWVLKKKKKERKRKFWRRYRGRRGVDVGCRRRVMMLTGTDVIDSYIGRDCFFLLLLLLSPIYWDEPQQRVGLVFPRSSSTSSSLIFIMRCKFI